MKRDQSFFECRQPKLDIFFVWNTAKILMKRDQSCLIKIPGKIETYKHVAHFTANEKVQC